MDGAVDKKPIAELLDGLTDIVRRGGPLPAEYPAVDALYGQIYAAGAKPQQVAAVYAGTLLPDCLHGYAYLKPRGYAGDFTVIDRIYTGWLSSDPQLVRHDEYFQSHAAPRAVRNRKEYFKNLLLDLAHTANGRPRQVLNIASGPARDMYEFFSAWPDAPVCVHCVDIDPGAIDYAAQLCSAFGEQVTFEQTNALRLRPAHNYDLIWCAGLFDYLDDHWFEALVRRFMDGVELGGQLVIGNFSTANSTRPAMELLCEWYLEHRSASDLREIASTAGAADSAICIDQEPEGVNLFLRIQRTEGSWER
jgi:extracellular factor (EF) 3-hydroxypalmitic acid methyl ester biosynthesis protein